MIRKFAITDEFVEEEISQRSGISGVVLLVGDFQKADANTPYLITNPRNIPDTVGNDPAYTGSKCLTQLFKKDEEQNNHGASAVIPLQMGTRTRASCTVDVDGGELEAETLAGGVWGNKLRLSLTNGLDDTFIFTVSDGTRNIIEVPNKSLDSIIKIVNGGKKHIMLTLTEDTNKTFTSVTNQAFTGGSETKGSFTIQNLYTVLNYLNKDKYNILLFSEKLGSNLFDVIGEYLDERYAKGKQSFSILPLTTTDNKETKIDTANSARFERVVYINQTINDLDEAETCARIAGAIAGLPVNESLSEYVLNDITSIHPVLSEDDIEDLTAAGIICLELKDTFSQKYQVYSSVTSCIDIGKDGQLVPQGELHGLRSSDYCFDKLNDVEDNYLAKTKVKRSKEILKSALDKAAGDIVKDEIVESIELSLEIDPKNPKNLIKDREIKVFNILEKIHNRDKIVWEEV
ncbi:phage tail sheath protein [Methanobrevibacter cuticularis]|uniref:Phage tail sheath protein n=1 Tax=Methanobrevibacter cuticularis TaxID=47311 RepID=A0A166CT76_9EURY|nr:hypothetical protein [Methanobrevibacter cuticularis]KZX16647.1 phage tail sheath protein [Methanobrevibacter cuticularis]